MAAHIFAVRGGGYKYDFFKGIHFDFLSFPTFPPPSEK